MRRALVFVLLISSCGGAAPPAGTPTTATSGPGGAGSTTPSATATPSPPPSQSSTTTPTATATPTGPVAPDFSLARFDGGTFRLRDFRNEIPVALNFWAPW